MIPPRLLRLRVLAQAAKRQLLELAATRRKEHERVMIQLGLPQGRKGGRGQRAAQWKAAAMDAEPLDTRGGLPPLDEAESDAQDEEGEAPRTPPQLSGESLPVAQAKDERGFDEAEELVSGREGAEA